MKCHAFSLWLYSSSYDQTYCCDCFCFLDLVFTSGPKPSLRQLNQKSKMHLRTSYGHLTDLDWDTFRLAFSDDATAFYPRAFPERANGRAEFEKTFKVVFDQIRGGKTKPPYMDIRPKEMKVQLFGNIAIATFHLDDRAGFLNRRTVVLRNTKTGWRIVHLHASEVARANQ